MKRIANTLLAAFVGGAVAIGGYRLGESKYARSAGIDEKQKTYFASNPLNVTSSTGNLDFTQAAAAVTPGVVHIKTKYKADNQASSDMDIFDNFFGRGQRMPAQPISASGSGVIVSNDGYIITNNHVVEDASEVSVILTDNRQFTAKVIGRDPNTDLALIKVEGKNLPVVKIGNSDNVKVGEWVLAVGYPFALESTVTAGIVSAKARSIGILQQERPSPFSRRGQSRQEGNPTAVESFIQTDAAINRGNSGGALVNANGELIGINAAIASQSGNYEGYGFAIPINLAKKVVDDFIKYGSVKRGYLGVSFEELNSDVAKKYGTSQINGLYVGDVIPNSGAAAAGIKAGDIIVKADGNTVYSSSDLQERVARLNPGDKVNITYLRDGKTREANIILKGDDQLNMTASNTRTRAEAEVANTLGARFTPATAAQKQRFRVASGVVVTAADPDSMFGANIPKGTLVTTINGKPVNNVADISAALKQPKDEGIVVIDGITPDGGRLRSTFPVGN
jgi:Do/DeqQ family serine protease